MLIQMRKLMRVRVSMVVFTAVVLFTGVGAGAVSTKAVNGMEGTGKTVISGRVNTSIDPAIRSILEKTNLFVSAFPDVNFDDWAYDDIRKISESGFINFDNGAERAPFRPDELITRGESATLISKLYETVTGIHSPKYVGEPSYTDVPEDHRSYRDIENTRRFLNDYPDGNGGRCFRPDATVTRGDFATALMKLSGADVTTADITQLDRFSDTKGIGKQWRYYSAIALQKNVLKGYENGTLGLSNGVSRREACALAVRSLLGVYEFPQPLRTLLYIPNLDSGFYDNFYNDAVFVGDSITQGLMIYVLNQRARGNKVLGDARFLAAQSYTLRAAASYNPGGVNVSYQGVEGSLEDCLYRMRAKDIYIMLGMNDGTGSIERYETIVNKISNKLPNADINIEFCTPVTKSREKQSLNNAILDMFNLQIVELCNNRDIDYVDVNAAMKDSQNALRTDYSSDKYVHMNTAGSVSWVKTLREFACAKYLTGEWNPKKATVTGINSDDKALLPENYPGAYIGW